jgi:putative DNA primase/helicase
MSERLISQCEGKWRGILVALGLSEKSLTGRHAPCPVCGGEDRFRFDDKAGSGSWFCSQCPKRAGYGIHLVQAAFGWDYARACNEIEAVLHGSTITRPDTLLAEPAEPRSDIARVRQLWRERSNLTAEDPGGLYLASRGIEVPAEQRGIAFHPRVLYLDSDGEFVGRYPALLAVVQDIDDKPVGVHRTFLTGAGRKADVPAPRKMLGSVPEGAAVRLAKRDRALGIAEGIETALSAMSLFGVPCWSAINSSGLASWAPPDEVREVVVFGDHDLKFGGQAAAYSLAHRLACKGIKVRVEIPETVGDDWNDVLMKTRAQPAQARQHTLNTDP